jgi:hypothetical protein
MKRPVAALGLALMLSPTGAGARPAARLQLDVFGFVAGRVLAGFPTTISATHGLPVIRSTAFAIIPGVVAARITAGAPPREVIVFRGRRRVHSRGTVTLRLRPTKRGKRLVRAIGSSDLPLDLTVTFTAHDGVGSREETITLVH